MAFEGNTATESGSTGLEAGSYSAPSAPAGGEGPANPGSSSPSLPSVTWDPSPYDLDDVATDIGGTIPHEDADGATQSPETTGQTEPTTEPSQKVTPPEGFDPTEYFAKLSHTDLAKIPAYNEQIQRGLAKQAEDARKEREAREAAEVEEYRQTEALNRSYQEWYSFFEVERQKGTLGNILAQDANARHNYGLVEKWVKDGGFVNSKQMTKQQELVARQMIGGLRAQIAGDPDLKDVSENFDVLWHESKDMATFIKKAVDRLVKAERDNIPEAIKAGVNKELAKLHLSTPAQAHQVNSAGQPVDELTIESYGELLDQGKIDPSDPRAQRLWASIKMPHR